MADNQATVIDALRKAGFSEDMIPTMVGIAGAESSFNPNAHNPNAATGDNSYGLFQINMLGGMGPERRAEFGIQSNEELFDPYVNAKAAKRIYDQQGLGAWSVHRSGAYKKYMPNNIPNNSSFFAGPQAGQAPPGGGPQLSVDSLLSSTFGGQKKEGFEASKKASDKLLGSFLTQLIGKEMKF